MGGLAVGPLRPGPVPRGPAPQTLRLGLERDGAERGLQPPLRSAFPRNTVLWLAPGSRARIPDFGLPRPGLGRVCSQGPLAAHGARSGATALGTRRAPRARSR